jgi:hypothetical protein
MSDKPYMVKTEGFKVPVVVPKKILVFAPHHPASAVMQSKRTRIPSPRFGRANLKTQSRTCTSMSS